MPVSEGVDHVANDQMSPDITSETEYYNLPPTDSDGNTLDTEDEYLATPATDKEDQLIKMRAAKVRKDVQSEYLQATHNQKKVLKMALTRTERRLLTGRWKCTKTKLAVLNSAYRSKMHLQESTLRSLRKLFLMRSGICLTTR